MFADLILSPYYVAGPVLEAGTRCWDRGCPTRGQREPGRRVREPGTRKNPVVGRGLLLGPQGEWSPGRALNAKQMHLDFV